MEIKPEEHIIKGSWNYDGEEMIADSKTKRIEYLIHEYLVEIKTDKSGWKVLYQDPKDKRYWELSYPKGDMHGGGPPLLKNISEEKAINEYGI